MNPKYFEQSNKKYVGGVGLPSVGELFVYSDGEQFVSCWKPTLRERISILLFGKVWLSLMSQFLPPICIQGTREFFEAPKSE